MFFEFDLGKSAINKQKHGISLEDAAVLWAVPHIDLAARSEEESRYMLIGKLQGRMYTCIYTKRQEKIRLISARRSRENEERWYYENIQATKD